ncbi:hypothetical protein ACWIG4_29860 [Streptomyces sp. NPDC002248]
MPFINDGRLPLDSPDAIERTGRNQGEGLWGRTDRLPGGGWVALTTEPKNRTYAWAVYYHPDHGWIVLLIRDQDQGSQHHAWKHAQEGHVHRHGGYWWDGTHWYRPGQVIDRAWERNDPRRVRDATTLTAEDLLTSTPNNPDRATVATIASFTAPEAPLPNWADHLALWARHRSAHPQALPLDACIVDLLAPELDPQKLTDRKGLAAAAGISPDDLPDPDYNRSGLPEPQREDQAGMWWAKPVALDWAEGRLQTEGPRALLAATTTYGTDQPIGVAADHDRLRTLFAETLSEQRRGRRPVRTPDVQPIADDLAWDAAANLAYGNDHGLVPHEAIADTAVKALLGSLANDTRNGETVRHAYDLSDLPGQAVKTLSWYIRRLPERTTHILGEICLLARVELELPPRVVGDLLHRSFYLDSPLDNATIDDLFDMALPPSARSPR